MFTHKLNCFESFCLTLSLALFFSVATTAQDNSALAMQIEKALKVKKPAWKAIGIIESGHIPLIPSERRIITAVWTGPTSRSQDVDVFVYSVETPGEARAWLRPVREKQVALGWRVSALQIGDEGYLSKYKGGNRFDLRLRRGTVVAKIAGNDLDSVKEFAQCVLEQIPAS